MHYLNKTPTTDSIFFRKKNHTKIGEKEHSQNKIFFFNGNDNNAHAQSSFRPTIAPEVFDLTVQCDVGRLLACFIT